MEYHKRELHRYIKEDAEIERIADTCNGMFAGNVSCEKYIRARY